MRDPGLDALLELDGQVLVVDPAGRHWVKFVVKQVAPSPERPHGLAYSLTLHDATGARLVGFDNAHAAPSSSRHGARGQLAHDHRHRLRSIGPYEYRDAASLLSDFWDEVIKSLKERGVVE
jgi:hypothetical protein